MIRLKRLNGSEIVVNAELIEWIESNPDTTITLATGSKIIVQDSADTVIQKVMEYRKELSAKGKSSAEVLLENFRKES